MNLLPFEIPPNAFDIAGVTGFCMYVMSYSLLTTQRIGSQSSIYFAINLVAASLVLFSLTASFNLASALIQMFWIVASIVAILIRRTRNRHNGQLVGPGQRV